MNPQPAIKTEADALRSILSWSQTRPAWQRDALRRLVLAGDLREPEDLDDLIKLCKDPSLIGEHLSDEHIGTRMADAPVVSLKKLSQVENVNALVEGQSLKFLQRGVTIIYGDNGAGKSGYARVLRQACRVRTTKGKEYPILHNVYKDSTGAQSAVIECYIGAQNQKVEWKGDENVDTILSEVSVFDSLAANVHVEETNDLAYTPFPMKVLERLVNVSLKIKNSIEGEIDEINGKTPQIISKPECSLDTKVGKIFSSLSKDTNIQEVEELANLTKLELDRLSELEADFALEPAEVTRRLNEYMARLETLQSTLIKLESAISQGNVSKLRALKVDYKTKREAAKLASQELSIGEPLEGVGSRVWISLWDAARSFSTDQAYRDRKFPVTDRDARCVLCQQELSQDASRRLKRFEDFVQNKTQKEESLARQKLLEFEESLNDAIIPRDDFQNELRFLEIEMRNPAASRAVKKFVICTKWHLRKMINEDGGVKRVIPNLSAAGISAMISDLKVRIKALASEDDGKERRLLLEEMEELRDRRWLSGIKNDVIAEVDRLKSISQLQIAQKDTKPNAITAKNTSLSEALITERLRRQFSHEIESLGLSEPEIEIVQARSQHGVSRFKVGLKNNTEISAGKILSEGEHRCVALASFLAELAISDSGSGIIFDDPVSSLDHIHRDAIAKRLADEGLLRQVIVFTHDLPFLFLLEKTCTKHARDTQKTEVALRHVQRRSSGSGYCRNEAPDKAKNALARLESMRNHLENGRAQYDLDPDSAGWLYLSRGIVDSIRQAWEAAVEDAVGPVLRTFSNKVDTTGFAKLSVITIEDAEVMRESYSRCSKLLHKESDEENSEILSPSELSKELDDLEKWVTGILNRQKNI